MKEKETDYLPIVPPPPEDDKPEDGFVPYCGSEEAAEAENQNKPKKKLVLLLILILSLIVVFAVSMVAKQFNFYHAVLSGLQFDYREGEAVLNESPDEEGTRAEALSREIGNGNVSVQTAMYMLDEKWKLQSVVSEYDYSHTAERDILSVRSGTENSLFMNAFSYRKTPLGNQRLKGREWIDDAEAYVPKLNEYFFGTEDHGGIIYSYRQSSEVEVGGKNYLCELWLMEDSSGPKTVYTTLYRYYSGSRLKGVRILFDFDNLVEVYDVRNYVIG